MKIVDTFFHNPQYRVVLEEVDEGDEEDKCTVIIALMQKNRRQMRRSGGIDLLTIGFAIYHVSQSVATPKPAALYSISNKETRLVKLIELFKNISAAVPGSSSKTARPQFL
jgi:hypothetical protein